MLFLALLISILLAAAAACLPAYLQRQKATRADVLLAAGAAAAVWVWALCVWSKPGLAISFDGFRLVAITAVQALLTVVMLGFRLRSKLPAKVRKAAVPVLLLAAAAGTEVFICNLNFFATHSYTPIDLRPYLMLEDNADAPLLLDENHNTLTFAGINQDLYNIQLVGLEYVRPEAAARTQDTLFILNVSALDEATSVSRQSWNWEISSRAVRSCTRSLDLSGKVSQLTLAAYRYQGEYRQYPLSYTLQSVYANVPRPMDISLVRFLALLGVFAAAFALRPASAMWRQSYLQHRKKYAPAAAVCILLLMGLTFVAPFADRYSAGVATSFYNTDSWDGESRVNFTLHINDVTHDTAAQYGLLAHSLLQGRLDLTIDPPETLSALSNPYDTGARTQNAPDALWDVAYYGGRYYVYFGVIPCLLFQLPFEALTGVADLPPSLPMIALSWILIFAVFGFIKQAARRWFPQMSAAVYLLLCFGAVTGSQVFYLLLRPSVYEYAILAGATFVLLALWRWMLAANQPATKEAAIRFELAFGSLSMALVAGCRPQMVVFAALAIPIFWQRYIREKRLLTRQGVLDATAFLLPVILIAAGLMWYNAARFGSPFDFGANYNLTSNDMTKRGFVLGRIAPALYSFLLGVPGVQTVFPYVAGTRMQTNYMGLTITELYYGGALLCVPLLYSFAAIPLMRKRLQRRGSLSWFVAITVACAIVLAVVDCEMAGMLYRYQSDWLGPLLLAAAANWALAEETLQEEAGCPGMAALTTAMRRLLPLAVLAGTVYSFCVYFAAEPGLLGQSPALYQNVSRLVQFWL